jgi:hypothetical protein
MFNNLESSSSLIADQNKQYRSLSQTKGVAHTHRNIARLIGMDPAEYVRSHTLVPFARIVKPSDAELTDFDELEARRRQKNNSAFVYRTAAYFCPECAAEERLKYGFSYWKRILQIPGINCCPEHAIPLAGIVDSNAFNKTPDSWRSNAIAVPQKLAKLGRESIVQRYAMIAKIFLETDVRVTLAVASKCISDRVRAIRFSMWEWQNEAFLSDYIRQSYPLIWLEESYPDLLRSVKSKIFRPIDATSRIEICRGQAYAMVLAALFDDAEEAAECFMNQSKTVPERAMASSARN